jgi:hypothetical protein
VERWADGQDSGGGGRRVPHAARMMDNVGQRPLTLTVIQVGRVSTVATNLIHRQAMSLLCGILLDVGGVQRDNENPMNTCMRVRGQG